MQQAQLVKRTFNVYSNAASARLPFASLCINGLLTVLDRLHLYSAPIILNAECIPDGTTLLSGKSHL